MSESISTPDMDLQKLISITVPRGGYGSRGLHDDEAVKKIIERNTSAAAGKYSFPKYNICHEFSPLYIAVRENASFEVISTLYRAYPMAAREIDHDGNTLLHCAVIYNKSPDTTRLLLEEWPRAIQVKDDEYGNAPLHAACCCGAPVEIISLLLDKWPAAAKVTNDCDNTPLYCACYHNASLEVVSLLLKQWPAAAEIQNDYGWTPLYATCKENPSVEIISLLLEKGPAAAKLKNDYGWTPLHAACWKGASVEIISLLLEHWPAAVQVKNINRKTPLDYLHSSCEKQKTMIGGIACLLNPIDPPTARQVMTDFVAIEWRVGMLLFFDLYTDSVKTFTETPLSVTPSVLFIMGCHCKLLTMWNVMRHRQDILKID